MTEIIMPKKPSDYTEVNELMRIDKMMDAIAEALKVRPLTEKELISKLALMLFKHRSTSIWVNDFINNKLLNEDNNSKLITLTKNYSVYHQCAKEYIKEAKLLHPEIGNSGYNYVAGLEHK